MSYIILNGKKSTLIQGLLISSLPPITKPMVRTEIEEIDGRDGDIVTKLGYSAYDKEMQIGLFGDYDLDEVIQFFNSEGTVIFSNEPDKFYNYQILEQIDFEALIRFKTATVVFHVQPFKQSAVDDVFTATRNQLTLRPFTQTQGGVTVTVENDTIKFQGQTTGRLEFAVPIVPMTVHPGEYIVFIGANGSGWANCTFKIIQNNPNETYLPTFSIGRYIGVEQENTVTYRYLWFFLEANKTYNFTIKDALFNIKDFSSLKVYNRGNTKSRPKLSLHGYGEIVLSVNGVERLTINMVQFDTEYITIDCQEMNAYNENVLKNRYVSGDYSKLTFDPGENVLSWSGGQLVYVTIENESRWI